MKRTITAAAFLTLVAALGYAKPKIHDSVHFAPSWETAVKEAKLLNVPIVVHNHGFN